jgi:uncharacterized protein
MVRVFYHNEIDMVSMVTLAARLVRQFDQPDAGDHAQDLISLGKWQAHLGLAAEAERNLRLAAELDLPLEQYHQALSALAALLKRQNRRDEAVPVWQQIAATTFDTLESHIELAKYYEWQRRDPAQALAWTRRALALLQQWQSGSPPPAYNGRLSLLHQELEHRRLRLESKQPHDATPSSAPAPE